MNKFIRKSLEPGERIVYNGRLHWSYVFTYNAWASVLLVAAVAGAVWNFLGEEPSPYIYYLAAAFAALALALWAVGRVVRTRSEFVVTASRFIQKDGIFNIHMKEIPLFKVETVNYHQTLFQRMIGTGGIELVGSGGTYHKIECISSPMEVRRAIVSAINQCNKPASAAATPAAAPATPEATAAQTPEPPAGEQDGTPRFHIDLHEEEES